MILIKDSMVLIHLAKVSLLETSCDYFGKVIIPLGVQAEISFKEYPDTSLILSLIEKGKIETKEITRKELIRKANELNIYRGEAEAVALCWELQADALATDDNNVRKKKEILQITLIGTPALLLQLYKKKKITRLKLETSIKTLKTIGWFSNTIWDKILLEVEKNE